jgi:hypothetical protein
MNSTAQRTNVLHNPASPSYFKASAQLLRITAQKASTPAELLAALHLCPEDSI